MIYITKKNIAAYLDNSPLMHDIRKGTLEQLYEFRAQLTLQVGQRRAATFRSFGYNFLLTVIGCSFVILLISPTLPRLIFIHLFSQIACAIVWRITTGSLFFKAMAIEKVMFALLDAAIEEKQLDKAQIAATN